MAGLLDFLLSQGGQGGGLLGMLGQQGGQGGVQMGPDGMPMPSGPMGGPMQISPPAQQQGLNVPNMMPQQMPQQSMQGMPQQPMPGPQPGMQQQGGMGGALDPSFFANQFRQNQQPPGMLMNANSGLLGGLRGALNQIADPQGQKQQQAFQNYTALKGMEDKPAFSQVGEDAFGNKQYGFVNAPQQKVTPYTPGSTTVGGVPTGSEGGGSDFLAKGVTSINHNLVGSDYLSQFSPEVQQSVKSYVAGEAMPTGNPRKGFTQTIKMIAQKYGNDMGTTADDASFAQRSQMLKNLAVSTPGSLGGQINFAGTSLEHLAATADKINELNNVNGLGIAPIAKLVNSVRQLTTDQAGKANAVTGAAQHYGQEVTKFYSGSPGGEAERSRFMNTLSTSKSPTELADALQTERELIPGRLDQLATQIKTTLGDTPQAQKYMSRIAEAQKAIPRIDASIARLRGQEPASTPDAVPAAPNAPARLSSKAQFDALPSGSTFIAPDGTTRRKP